MRTKKFFFYVFFTAQLVGLCGFFGKIIYDSVQNLQSTVVGGDISKDTLVLLGVLFTLGFVGVLASNKLVDQLNKLENAINAT
ncbi:MAG: hypothetical protein WCW04_03505 [Candidatus Paceibacterota bacterium]